MAQEPQRDLPSALRGGSDVWDQPQAGVVLTSDWFQTSAVRRLKAWNGSQWVGGTLKRWSGSQWVVHPVKRWTGAQWMEQ